MYESPINQILGEMQITYENECMKAVQSCGFDVDKEELTKALMYDRGQYEKGYADASREFAKELIARLETEICIPQDLRFRPVSQDQGCATGEQTSGTRKHRYDCEILLD